MQTGSYGLLYSRRLDATTLVFVSSPPLMLVAAPDPYTLSVDLSLAGLRQRICKCQIRRMLTGYERHPTMLLIRRCRRGSTTSGESRFVKCTFGSTGVSTGLQSHIPKVRSTRSAYPACTIFLVLAALSLITSSTWVETTISFPYFPPFGRTHTDSSKPTCSNPSLIK
jgi:hypothetical protein